MRFPVLLTLCTALLLPACDDEGGDEGGGNVDPARIDAITALSGDAAAGETVYARCSASTCHGSDGDSGTGGSRLSAEVPAQSDEGLIEVVLGGYETMPAQNLSDQEMADLLAYLRSTFG